MKITIYATSICPACHALTHWLDKIGQVYEKKITDTDDLIMAEFMQVNDGIISAPFTVIKDDSSQIVAKVAGFDQGKFKKYLGV